MEFERGESDPGKSGSRVWRRGSCSHRTFGIEQLGEARIVGYVAEVRVIAGLKTIAGVEPDGLGQVLETLRGAPGEALQHGQAIPDEVERGTLAGEVLEMLAGGDEVAEVHEGDDEIVVLLGGGKGVLDLIQLLVTDVDVDLGAIAQLADSGFNHLLEQHP